MKQKKKTRGGGLPRSDRRGKAIVLTGIVTPAGWDETASVVEILIATPDESEFLIRSDDTGKELLAYIHERVRVKGYLVADDQKGIMIAVDEFDLINNDETSDETGKPLRRKYNATY